MTAPSTPPGSEDAGLVLSAEELACGWCRETWFVHGDLRPDDQPHCPVCGATAVRLTPILAARLEAEQMRIAAALKVESDKASVRELSDPNAYARRCAYDNAARIARTPDRAAGDDTGGGDRG